MDPSNIFLGVCLFASTMGGRIFYKERHAAKIERFLENKLIRPFIVFSIAYVSAKNIHTALIMMLTYFFLNYVVFTDTPNTELQCGHIIEDQNRQKRL